MASKDTYDDEFSFWADEQAPARLPLRGEGQARAAQRQGRREGAARAARQQRPVPVRVGAPLSRTAAATAAAFDGAGRADYFRERW